MAKKGGRDDKTVTVFQGKATVRIVELFDVGGESLPPIVDHLRSGKAAMGYVVVGGRTYKLIDAEAHARFLREEASLADMLPPDAQDELHSKPEHEGGVCYTRGRGKPSVNWLTTNVLPIGKATSGLELNVAEQEDSDATQVTITEPANIPGAVLSVWHEGREVFLDCVRFPVIVRRAGIVTDSGLCLADVMPSANPNKDPNGYYRMTILSFDGFAPTEAGHFKPLHAWQVFFTAYDLEELEPEEVDGGGVVAFRVILKNARVVDAGRGDLN